jgi:hypothetical protein
VPVDNCQTGTAPEVLMRVIAPHFVAGVVVRGAAIVEAAPIVRYMIGWNGRRFARYCGERRWRFEVVDEP